MKTEGHIKYMLLAFLCFSKICFAGNSDTTKNPVFTQYEEASRQFYEQGEFDSAIIVIKKGIELSITTKDKNKEAGFLLSLASVLSQKGHNDSALAVAFKTLEIDQNQ